MEEGQIVQLAERVSAQKHGIVLVFCDYNVGSGPANSGLESFFVSKATVSTHNGWGHRFILLRSTSIYTKYIYIADDHLTGNAENNATNRKIFGNVIDQRNKVLIRVEGV